MSIMPGNAQYLGARKDQQDTFWVSQIDDSQFTVHGGVLAIVADGMGGLANGAEASHLAVDTFTRCYLEKTPDQTVRVALDQALELCNKAVYNRSISINERNNFGTTLVAAVIIKNELYWCSVGDSRIYLCRNNELTQLSQDHSQGHYLTSYIGDSTIDEIDRNIRPFRLQPGDRIVLCSDGLHGVLSDDDILNELHHNPQDSAERLIERIKAVNSPRQDNTTVVILGFDLNPGSPPLKKIKKTKPAGRLRRLWKQIKGQHPGIFKILFALLATIAVVLSATHYGLCRFFTDTKIIPVTSLITALPDSTPKADAPVGHKTEIQAEPDISR